MQADGWREWLSGAEEEGPAGKRRGGRKGTGDCGVEPAVLGVAAAGCPWPYPTPGRVTATTHPCTTVLLAASTPAAAGHGVIDGCFGSRL